MHEIVSLCLAEGNKGVPTLKACKQVADLVQAEVGSRLTSVGAANRLHS